MDDLFQAAGEVQVQLLQQGRPFCFIGGLAVIRWGTPRVTRDLDVSVLAPSAAPLLKEEPEILQRLLARRDAL